MELLPLPQNDDFVKIVDNLSTECSSDNITMILDSCRSELNPPEAYNKQLDDNQQEHFEIETTETFQKLLKQLFV